MRGEDVCFVFDYVTNIEYLEFFKALLFGYVEVMIPVSQLMPSDNKLFLLADV